MICVLLSGCSYIHDKSVSEDNPSYVDHEAFLDAITFSSETIDVDYAYEQFVCEKIGQQIAKINNISSATVSVVPNDIMVKRKLCKIICFVVIAVLFITQSECSMFAQECWNKKIYDVSKCGKDTVWSSIEYDGYILDWDRVDGFNWDVLIGPMSRFSTK